MNATSEQLADLRTLVKTEGMRQLWSAGVLDWKLPAHMLKLYNKLRQPGRKHAYECHRKFGKTTTAIVFADEECRRSTVVWRYWAQNNSIARDTVLPIMENHLRDCPEDLRPRFSRLDNCFEYPNGSKLYIVGCDDIRTIEAKRGPYSDGNIIDEAGYNDYLEYLYKSVISPQQIAAPNPIAIFISSTSKIPGHYFFTVAAEAEATGTYASFTLDDNDSLTDEQKRVAIEEAGGRGSVDCEREYFNSRKADPGIVILAEYDDSMVREIAPNENWEHYQRYNAADWGVEDSTFCGFGTSIFESGILYIEDEFELSGNDSRTDRVHEEIDAMNARRGFGRTALGKIHPKIRQIGDNELRALNDLNVIYGHSFSGVEKSTLEAMVKELRVKMKQGQIVIHPRCTKLAGQCRNGIWKKVNVDFARVPGYGHFDGIAMLIYMNRMADRLTNPIPHKVIPDPFLNAIAQQQSQDWQKIDKLNSIFGA